MLFSRRWMLCCRRRNIRTACLNFSDADALWKSILLFIKLNFINTFEKEHNLFTFSAYYKQCQDEEHEPREQTQTQRQTNNFFFFVIRRETELLPLLMRDGHPAGWPFFSCRIQTCGLSGILIHKWKMPRCSPGRSEREELLWKNWLTTVLNSALVWCVSPGYRMGKRKLLI